MSTHQDTMGYGLLKLHGSTDGICSDIMKPPAQYKSLRLKVAKSVILISIDLLIIMTVEIIIFYFF